MSRGDKRTEKRFFHHCELRALQRYSVELTLAEYRWLCQQIRRRNQAVARLIVRQRGGSVWLVLLRGQWCVVAWVNRVDLIATFLPLDAQFDDAGVRLRPRLCGLAESA